MITRLIVSAFGLFLLASSHAMACPACKDSYVKGSQNASVGESYSWSVLFMLAVPMTILTVFTVVIARRIKAVQRVGSDGSGHVE